MPANLSRILDRRMRELGLNYADLAARINKSSVYVSRIVQGRVVPSDEVLYLLCSALELDLARVVLLAHEEKAPSEVKPVFARLRRHGPEEFLGDVDSFDNLELSRLGRAAAVPVVGLVQAGAFSASEDGGFPAGAADAFVYTDQKARNLFAVRVINDSMEPEFHEGDVLIVNPNLTPQSGDYVIAKLPAENEATFKKLVVHDKLVILRPLNPRYADIVLDAKKVELVGKVVERKTLF